MLSSSLGRVPPRSRVANYSLNLNAMVPASMPQRRVAHIGSELQPEAQSLRSRRAIGDVPVAPTVPIVLFADVAAQEVAPLETCPPSACTACAGVVGPRMEGACSGECFARLQDAVAENAALRQQNAILEARLRRAEGISDLAPPRQDVDESVESDKLYVSGLHVASNTTPQATFLLFCKDVLHMDPVPIVAGLKRQGINRHGLSHCTVRLQSRTEAKRTLRAVGRFLDSSSTVSINWNRSRAQRADQVPSQHTTSSARIQGGPRQSLNHLAAVFQPRAELHHVNARTRATELVQE